MANVTLGEPRFIKPEVKKMESKDFDITFELDKSEETVVPFGIKDFKNNIENPFFSFKYTLSKSKIDSLEFLIMDEDDKVIYQMTHLKGIVVEASKKQAILFEAKKPTEGPFISKTWDFEKIFSQYTLSDIADYTDVGEYYIHWDGFDDNEIYDSTRFNGKDLKAKITATKGDKMKSITIDFSTNYSEVQWTDVKIDRNAKRIDVTLRVNLTDGGAKGLNCSTYSESEYTLSGEPNPFTGIKVKFCDWDKVPASEIKPNKPPLQSRTKARTFQDLEKLTLEGLNYHWGRNKNHFIAKNIKMNNDSYEIYMDAKNVKENEVVTIDLIYNTNNKWGRSGNPGILGRIYYNEGYLEYSNGWGYVEISKATIEYKHTSAHEIGHSILVAYGDTSYSWQHKGSSYLLPQDVKPVEADKKFADNFKVDNMKEILGEYYPQNGEIDLMKYYNYEYDKTTGLRIPVKKIEERSIATEKDLMMLMWLTKVKIS